MQKPKHTPGPWIIGYNSFIFCKTPISPVSRDSLEYYGGYLICDNVAPQNLPIIASAPELLEVLKDARNFIQDQGEDISGMHGKWELLDKIDAVIARAES
jgi:hypothetical protein